MKNILFVNPPSPWLIQDRTYLGLGPLYIASYLEKNGYQVGYQDLAGVPEEKWVIPEGYDVYAVGATSPQVPTVTKISKIIKSVSPNSVSIIGGIHASVLPKEILENSDFDIAVIGEGEYTVKEIMEGKEWKDIKGMAFKTHDGIIINEERELIKDLDSLPYPAYHLVDILSYSPAGYKMTGSLISSRGCWGKCIFCAQQKITKRKVRYRSVENVVGEIRYLKETYGLETFCFEDETFVMGKSRLKEFCKEIKKLNIHFKCQSRVEIINKEMTDMLKDAGCFEMSFGFESGSQRILDIIMKGSTVEQSRKAAKICKESGLRVFAFLIVGCPTEDDSTIDETIKFVDEIQPDGCGVAMFTPYPGTDVFEYPERYQFEFTRPDNYNIYRMLDKSGHGIALHKDPDTIYRLHERLLNHVKDKSSFTRKNKRFDEAIK